MQAKICAQMEKQWNTWYFLELHSCIDMKYTKWTQEIHVNYMCLNITQKDMVEALYIIYVLKGLMNCRQNSLIWKILNNSISSSESFI